MKYRANKSTYLFVLLFLIIFSRIIVSEKYFYGYDSVNYALAVENFSLAETHPHLPGSILFVKSIAVFTFLTNDVHLSFLLLIQLFSILATIFSYEIFLRYFNIIESFLLTLFLIFNPMVWFYGAVTEIYVFDWFFVSLVLHLSYKKSAIYLLPLVYALGSGFRPSSGVLLLPFYFYLLWNEKKTNWKYLSLSILFAFSLFFGWFIPLTENVGGISNYFELFSKNNPVEKISFAQNIFRLSSIAFYLLLPFVTLLFIKWRNLQIEWVKFQKLLFLIVPAVLFFILFHYSKGYALVIITPLVLLFGILIKKKLNNAIQIAVVLEIAIFLFLPSKITSLDSKIKPERREGSIAKIWIDRTLSDYSLTSSQIVKRDAELHNLINFVEATKKSKIILGPLLSHMGRALQIYYPNKNIFAVNFRDGNKFIHYFENKVNLRKVLPDSKNGIILLKKEVYRKYFNNLTIEYKLNELIGVKLSDKVFKFYEGILYSQFVR